MNRHAVNRGTTLALIRQLRAAAPAQRPRRRMGRIPKPQQPRAIEAAYWATLRRQVCAVARDCFQREAPEILHALEQHRAAKGHTDSQADGVLVVRGRSRRDKAAARVALVLAWNAHGQLLLGKRRAGGAWTLPGGHLLPGERPLRGAARELEEETNLTSADLSLADAFTNPDGVQVWLYTGTVRGAPTGYFDPDQECSAWRFVDVAAGLPDDVASNLAGPPPPDNVLARLFGTGAHADARKRRTTAAPPPPPRGGPAHGAAEARAEAERLRKRAQQLGAQLAAASEQGKRAAMAIDRAARAWADVFAPDKLHEVVLQFGKRTDTHAREQLDQQLRSAIGVPLSAIERRYRDQLDLWAAENVDLIETVPERYFDRLRLDVLDAFEGGTHPYTLADEFTERYDMSERDAERIARDQVLSLQADMLQARLVDLGVEEYIWRTVGDGRVRDNHAALDGQRCRFDQPPDGGGTDEGEDGNPGDGILCRCYPEPIFDVLEEPDSAAG